MKDPKLEEMTMRDLFAMFAVQGMLSDPNTRQSWAFFARDAYELADEMLKRREEKHK